MWASVRRAGSLAAALLVLLAVSQPAPIGAQSAAGACSLTWIGHEDEFEQAMRAATIVRLEKVKIGVTKPQRAILDPPAPVARFAFKPLKPGIKNGYFESYKSEIAAYRLDRLLDLQMVPPVIARDVNGKTGAAVYWIEGAKGWQIEHPVEGPQPEWSHQITRMKMLDLLIANVDRNQGNLLYDPDWHLLLTDHSRAFTAKKDLRGIAALAHVDRALWEKMQALTLDRLQAALGEWLGPEELKAMLIRRDLMAAQIKNLVGLFGESAVFF
jgi:hypothetical protein